LDINVGKVREVYSALSVDDSGQYEIVKNAILKACELVPEAYQQKFRNTVIYFYLFRLYSTSAEGL